MNGSQEQVECGGERAARHRGAKQRDERRRSEQQIDVGRQRFVGVALARRER